MNGLIDRHCSTISGSSRIDTGGTEGQSGTAYREARLLPKTIRANPGFFTKENVSTRGSGPFSAIRPDYPTVKLFGQTLFICPDPALGRRPEGSFGQFGRLPERAL